MLELYIENQPADIGADFSTLLTFCVDDVKDFAAKNTNSSKTIILPGTKRNNALFGNIFNINRSTQYTPGAPNFGFNFNVAVHANALIFADNIQVFKGILRLMQINIDNNVIEYEAAVFGELGGFAATVGAKKLTDNLNFDGTPNPAFDLDFSTYNHAYNVSSITGSWDTASAGAGFYYGLTDYGTYGRNAAHSAVGKHSWQYKTFRPSLYVAEYLTKIFAAAGYTYNFPLLATPRFKSLIIPHNQKVLAGASSILLSAAGTATGYGASGSGEPALPFQNMPTLGNFTYNPTTFLFTYTGTTSMTATFNFSFSGQCTLNNTGDNLFLTLGNIYAATYNEAGDISINTSILKTFNTGDTFNLTVGAAGSADPSFSWAINNMSYAISFQASTIQAVPLNLNETVKVNNAIPKNILQLDFVSSIIKLFNLYVFEDPTTPKKLNIMPFADFFSNAVTIDWTTKLDRSKPIIIKPMSELNARYYTFNFKNDSDYFNDLYTKRYNENYGSVTYDSGFEFATDKQDMTLIFSGSPLVGYPGEDKVYTTILKSSGGVEENIDSNIRILQAKKITGVSGWDILDMDGVTVLSTQTNYGYAGHYDDPNAPANDIQYGVPKELFFTLATGALNINQFNVYYSSYMAEITDPDSKLLTAFFRLTRLDIYNLSFANFIWIDGNLFRINKITDYNATVEDTCNVELLKCINTIY